jgi:very-short-patch-repair endonuclease
VDDASRLVSHRHENSGMDRDALQRLASKNLGVFTRAQARACGFTRYQIRRRLEDGDWKRVAGSGLALAGLKITPLVRDRAAQLSVPGSVLGGLSAARTWQLPVPDRGTFLYVGPHGAARWSGVRPIYETPAARDVSLFNGMPTVGRAPSIVDCLRLLGMAEATALLDRALQAGWVTVEELDRRIRSRRRRIGNAQLRGLLEGVRGGERSAGERRLTLLLRTARITGWEANVDIRDDEGLIGVGDLVFREAKLVVEVDGLAYHVTPERFERDRRRQNRLVAAGWTVLRFTWRDLTERPGYVVDSVRRLTQG